jgi:enoyl-[acyl-carrier protein] reductase II
MSELTKNPFGVNLPILFLQDESIVDFVAECGVKFVTTSAGSPAKYINKLKEAGLTVYHAVPSLAGALKAADAGVDGLVVEGTEGGGFKNPEEVGLFVLIQAIRRKIDLPIIAAGGIADGQGMAAAFAIGAEGIQMGTRFVSSKESPVHENWKNAILSGTESDTYVLNKTGSPCLRAIKTDYTKEIFEKGSMDMSVFGGVQDLYFGGDLNAAPALTGQSMGLIDEIKSVETIINETVNEFNLTCQNLSSVKL